jgi:hypothetical protein
MPDENPTRTPGPHLTSGDRDFGEMESIVLYLLTDPEHQPTIWSVPDIGRAMAYYDPMRWSSRCTAPDSSTGSARSLCSLHPARSTSSRWSAKSSEPLHECHAAGLGVALQLASSSATETQISSASQYARLRA